MQKFAKNCCPVRSTLSHTGRVNEHEKNSINLVCCAYPSRVASKAFATAQSSAMQDLVKWSLKDENRAIQDALTQVPIYGIGTL
jgi:hypothetical protein